MTVTFGYTTTSEMLIAHAKNLRSEGWGNTTIPDDLEKAAAEVERLTKATDGEGEIARLRAERDFLLARSGKAGSCSFGGERWTGLSSNALVDVAFGRENKRLPADEGDLAACYRTVMRMPAHLRTDAVFAQLEEGERVVIEEYGNEWALESTGWPGRAALQQGTAR